MSNAYPVGRSADGRNYVCPRDATVLPDGVVVQGHWTAGSLDGCRVVRTSDGSVAHSCGTLTGLAGVWSGQHG